MDKLLAMVLKNEKDCTVWYPDIPADEPLLVQLIEKYTNSGMSVRGTQADIMEDLRDNLVWWTKEDAK